MRVTTRAAVALTALFLSAPAWALDDDAHDRALANLARTQDRPAGNRTRGNKQREHDGFYFRADTGLGFMEMNLPLASEASYSGLAVISGLHIGGTPSASAPS